ncbi:hypothetical protein GCM10011583_59870 [Streptomyces camponoticapitis]|uniref:Uncharacterized protein n=1 Tax=Streptomyces camponoticapitis TaxID=1616125 RepID=A0ABQ2ETI2_9ACTN|nr:DUF6296 family protein [Streptomyces camponoticapitis]GGK20031.1 hypothetical protein GCM10011583_59870 [Streptomyces camponoticapitis]
MAYPERYELVFDETAPTDPSDLTAPGPDHKERDVVTVRRTARSGAGGFPVYEDETGIVRAEISDRGEVRMLASGGQQALSTPVKARSLGS